MKCFSWCAQDSNWIPALKVLKDGVILLFDGSSLVVGILVV